VLSEVEFSACFDLKKISRLSSAVGFTERRKSAYGEQRLVFEATGCIVIIAGTLWPADRLHKACVSGPVFFDQYRESARGFPFSCDDHFGNGCAENGTPD
jgi:hypothetical protein